MVAARAIHWSKQAVLDMKGIARRIAADSPANARKLMLRIAAKVESLATFPEIGHAGSKAGTRELVVHTHYLVVYRILPGGIHVLRVKHSARK